MNREKSEKKEILQNRNLGALNVRDFGVENDLENDLQWRNKENVSDKLKRERAKAEDVLKLSRRDYFDDKENEQSYDTPDLNYSDYEPYRVPKPISNISDLFVDTTINLGNFTNMPTDTKAPKISFEPSEMTARSTYLHRDQQKERKSTIDRISVDDILSSSGAHKVQNLRHSICSTSSINYNGTHSLPRTADMSSNISKNYEVSFGAVANSFGENINCGDFSSENFAPGELMESKLIEGEISWAQKYAAIPTKVLSKDAKERAQLDGGINAEFFDSTYDPNLLMFGDSIGQYFNERVENISDILPNKYPVRSFTPRALIDNTISKSEGSPKKIKSHESKDSGHASDNSNTLSLSAIDRALARLDLDDSPTRDVNKFIDVAKTPRFHNSRGLAIEVKESVARNLENKENLDPRTNTAVSSLSDTLSFTESMLDPSYIGKDELNKKKSRSPLSPLESGVPKIHINDYGSTDAADVDEWPSPDGNSNKRRVKRKKSPKDKVSNPYRAVVANDSSPEKLTSSNKSPRAEKLQINEIDKSSPTSKNLSGTQRCGIPIVACNRTPLSSPIKDPSPRGSLYLGNVCKNDEKAVEVYRSTSPYSTSSEFSHRDGKIIPIKVTALSLSWGCSKLRIPAYKSIQVKNTFNKRLVLRAEIHGPGFQIVNTQNTSTITLQSQECRTITISFCPTVTGEAIGEFILCSPHSASSNNATYVRIPLYAYGGHASIKVIEAIRAPDNTFFLPMGNVIELPCPLEQSFKLYNKGPLLGFAIISVDSGSFNLQREIDSFTIEPNHVLINPDSSVNIRVTFKPKREYLKKILKKAHSVQVLGTLHVFSGAEVNRQRLRRIVRNIPSEERSEKLGLAPISELNGLWDVFPEEIELSELEAIKDDKDSANEFITAFVVNEIALILNCDDLSDTVVSSSPSCRDVDETVIFRSPIPSPTPNQVEENLHEKSNASEEEGAVSSTQEVNWSVYPDFINFVMKSECHSFVIVNSYKSRQYFEVSCNAKNLLILKPSEGYIDPDGGGTMINVTLVNKELPVVVPKGGVMINVYIENERKTIPVIFSNNKN